MHNYDLNKLAPRLLNRDAARSRLESSVRGTAYRMRRRLTTHLSNSRTARCKPPTCTPVCFLYYHGRVDSASRESDYFDIPKLSDLWGTADVYEHWDDGTDMEAILRRTCNRYVRTTNNLWKAICLLLDDTPGDRWIGDAPDTDPTAGRRAIEWLDGRQLELVKEERERTKMRSGVTYANHEAESQDCTVVPGCPRRPFEVADTVFTTVLVDIVHSRRAQWLTADLDRLTEELVVNSAAAGYPLSIYDAQVRVTAAADEWCRRLEPHTVLRQRKDPDRNSWQVNKAPVSRSIATQWWLWNAHFKYASDLASQDVGSADGAELYEKALAGAKYVVSHQRNGTPTEISSQNINPVARELLDEGLGSVRMTATNYVTRDPVAAPEMSNFTDHYVSLFGTFLPY